MIERFHILNDAPLVVRISLINPSDDRPFRSGWLYVSLDWLNDLPFCMYYFNCIGYSSVFALHDSSEGSISQSSCYSVFVIEFFAFPIFIVGSLMSPFSRRRTSCRIRIWKRSRARWGRRVWRRWWRRVWWRGRMLSVLALLVKMTSGLSVCIRFVFSIWI